MQSPHEEPYPLFNKDQLFYWENENISALINNNKLTIEQFMQLNASQLWSLGEKDIAELIINDILTIEEFRKFNSEQLRDLSRKSILALITNRHVTIVQFMQFSDEQQRCLRYENVCDLIANNTLTVEQFVQFNIMQLTYLGYKNINSLIAGDHLTIEQFMQFDNIQLSDLDHDNIANLITHENLTIEQFIQLNPEEIDVLIHMDEDTLIRLLEGHLNIEDVIGGNTITINDEQSTHNAAVYKSVSTSIIKLKQNYEQFINTKDKLEAVIANIKHIIFNLPDSLKNKAAKCGINRLIADNCLFIDQNSKTTIKQLLALAFLAILDGEKRTKNNIIISPEEAMEVFVQGLYEIQRGYNLNYNQVDDMMEDRPICPGGTFNKLIEKLVGIHPDCNICFITHETEALKFPKVVEKEALRYLTQLANPNTCAEFLIFTRLITSIKQDGLQIIYNQIKDSVANIMFKEFGSLYVSEIDESFINLISTIEDVELDDNKLEQFQRSIKNSQGYQQYCSNLLYRSTGNLSFLSTQKSKESGNDDELEIYFSNLSLSKK